MSGAILSAFLVAFMTIPLLARAYLAMRVLDVPNYRSSHTGTAVRSGGVSLYLAIVTAWGLGFQFNVSEVAWLISGYFLLGLVDDIRSLAPTLRIVIQYVLALASLVIVTNENGTISALALAASALGMVLIINATNFYDGTNGNLTATAIVACIYILAVSQAHSVDGFGIINPLVSPLLGGLLAFLLWNGSNSSRIFLGDSGSYLIGIILTLTVVVLVQSGLYLVLALAPLWCLLTDVLWTLSRRLWHRENLFKAHREHLYQQVALRMRSHQAASAITALSATSTACLALLLLQVAAPHWVCILLAIGCCIAYVLLMRSIVSHSDPAKSTR